MKKETIIAIILGVAFGSGVALFLIFNTQKSEQAKVIPVNTASRLTPVVAKSTTPKVLSLTVTSPEQGIITDKESVTIKGKASKNALMVIQSPIKQIVVQLKNDEFSQDFPLALGENSILISVYPADTKIGVQERTLTVYRLEEK